MNKKRFALLLMLLSLTAVSQNGLKPLTIENQNGLITLQNLVDKIKLETESLRNVTTVNVMVNDLLIENLGAYLIDPKNISTKEILILDGSNAKQNGTKASIIINTRIK